MKHSGKASSSRWGGEARRKDHGPAAARLVTIHSELRDNKHVTLTEVAVG